jgi:L,D-peptidoglycan transpeptidase YkuD (ErfK/YbiS/YcfS/YnhG family)
MMNLIIKNATTLILGCEEIPIVIGAKGIKKDKIEGDLSTPQGRFGIGPIFGHAKKPPLPFKIDYLSLEEDTVVIDDPHSKYYNRIVRESKIRDQDWVSCERMGLEPLYELGAIIQYNLPQPIAGRGSAIFIHRWENEKCPTAGCIAMSRDHLIKVLLSLDDTSQLLINEF